MTITTNVGFDNAAAAPVVGVLSLVELEFSTGTLYLTTWPTEVVVGGKTYTGLGTLASVGELRESEDGSAQTLPLTLSQVNSAHLSLALGNPNVYQGRAAKVYVALTNPDLTLAGSPVLRFSGFMDKVSIKRTGDNVGSVVLECGTGGYDVRKIPSGLRMNDVQHQSRFPGERGFEYVQNLIEQPQLWLSKRFQTV